MFPSATAPERRADFIIHVIGLAGIGAGSVFLVRAAMQADDGGLGMDLRNRGSRLDWCVLRLSPAAPP